MLASADHPLVTIVTATLNCGPLLAKTIASVRGQEYSKIEFIIIDGGSSDNTVSIVDQNRDLVTHFVSENDAGVYDAMNKGLRLASEDSRYVTFLNAGDVFCDGKVFTDITQAGAGSTAHLYGNVMDGGSLVETPEKITSFGLAARTVCHQAFFFRTEQHRKTFYDEHFKICADYKLLIDMLNAGQRFQKVQRLISICDLDGLSRTNRQTLHAEKKAIRARYPKIVFYFLLRRWVRMIQRQPG